MAARGWHPRGGKEDPKYLVMQNLGAELQVPPQKLSLTFSWEEDQKKRKCYSHRICVPNAAGTKGFWEVWVGWVGTG